MRIAQDATVSMHGFDGATVREWRLSRPVQLLAPLSGADRQDAFLVGLQGGEVLKMDVNNESTTPLLCHASTIECAFDEGNLAMVCAPLLQQSAVTCRLHVTCMPAASWLAQLQIAEVPAESIAVHTLRIRN